MFNVPINYSFEKPSIPPGTKPADTTSDPKGIRTDPSLVEPSHLSKPTHEMEQGSELDYDEIVVDLCNNKMKVLPPITVDDIERSHPTGRKKDGVFQLYVKFKFWKIKNRVYRHKKNLKLLKT